MNLSMDRVEVCTTVLQPGLRSWSYVAIDYRKGIVPGRTSKPDSTFSNIRVADCSSLKVGSRGWHIRTGSNVDARLNIATRTFIICPENCTGLHFFAAYFSFRNWNHEHHWPSDRNSLVRPYQINHFHQLLSKCQFFFPRNIF